MSEGGHIVQAWADGLDERPSTADGKDSRTLYIEQLRAEAAVYPQVPDVEVSFDFSYNLTLPSSQVNFDIPTVATKFRDLAMTPVSMARSFARALHGGADSQQRVVSILKDCRGTMRPGSMTLLLSPPGHGKTTFLKVLAGRIQPSALDGAGVTYSGLGAAELAARGVQLKLLSNYVDQLDTHLPYLTVRETAQFACTNSTVEPAVMGDEMLAREAANRVQRVLKLLHLESCADTLVGNDLVRGVSGGEKKRVTVAEALVSNARLLCMDEISTGLDASVTYDICASIATWAHEMRGTVVIALLQPTPEVYDLFDDVMLLREGTVVYHGPRPALPDYLRALGYAPPSAKETAADDMADWLVELLASPSATLKRQAARAAGRSEWQLAAHPSAADALEASEAAAAAEAQTAGAPRTTAALAAAWVGSELCKERESASKAATVKLALESDFAKRQYGKPNPRSNWAHFQALLVRQYRITARNSLFVFSRMGAAIIISIILGLLWYQLSMSQGLVKFGMLLFAVLQIGFANLGEVPFAVEYKYVAYKHIQAGMYPAWAYTLAGSIMQVPIALVETAAFSLILYFMVGLVNDGGRWAFFYLMLFLVNMSVGSMYRCIAYLVKDAEAANSAPGPFIAINVIFAGFLVAPKHMGTPVNGFPWMEWLYYSTLFSYPLRSVAHNEFYAPQYDIYAFNSSGAATLAGLPGATPITAMGSALTIDYYPKGSCAAHPALDCGGQSYGVLVLKALNVDLSGGWKWGGMGFVLATVILFNILAGWALGNVRIERNVGSSRAADEDEPQAPDGKASGAPVAPAEERVALEVAPPGSVASVLPFTPMTLAWRDLKYTVALNKHLGGGTKVLLQKVGGIAVPGRLIALMGASGAGKSTLLDVIAGRKTAGEMEGGIYINGFPRESKSFARLTAYCEQQDVHNSFATVREAFQFSAACRLPRSVPAATRAAFVAEVLDLLQLNYIAHRMIGEVGAANGLSPGQRKVLTMGVELVSNAPILFLDEPTSGLDSRAASHVIRTVKKVAETGRTVITTIHQPSVDVFAKFDDILLLQRGGWMAYFGPLGARGRHMVAYLERVPGVRPCPASMNPGTWMLDVLAGADSGAGHAAPAAGGGPAAMAAGGEPLEGAMLQETLFGSEEWRGTLSAVEEACRPADDKAKPYRFDSVYVLPLPRQLAVVLSRTMVSYHRNVGYMYTKIMVIWALMILFGVVYYKVVSTVVCAPATGADDFACQNDTGGVQSVISLISLAALFTGVISMNTVLPVLMRERAVFYRERFSRMYAPEAHSLSYAIAELPWLVFLVLLTYTGFYFMVGFNNTAEGYFFFHFVIILLSYIFIALGQWASANFPTTEVASAALGLLIPIIFLFCGLYVPPPMIPNGDQNGHPGVYLQWAYYADPLSYALEALLPMQFADRSSPSTVDHKIMLDLGATLVPVDTFDYVTKLYGMEYGRRWRDVGILGLYIVGFQLLHVYAVRYKAHIDR